jgi:hypothetical protein
VRVAEAQSQAQAARIVLERMHNAQILGSPLYQFCDEL